MVVYEFDSNEILAAPIKNMQAENICDVFIKISRVIKSRGRYPKEYIMGTKCSIDLKQSKKKYYINFQLSPPNMHH